MADHRVFAVVGSPAMGLAQASVSGCCVAVLVYAAGEVQERALAVVLAGSAVFPVSMATVLWGRGDTE